MAQCTVTLDVLYGSHAEAIQAKCLNLGIDVLVRTSELGTGLLRLLHEQLTRERGDVTRSEDTAMDLRGGGRDIKASWYGHGHGSLTMLFV